MASNCPSIRNSRFAYAKTVVKMWVRECQPNDPNSYHFPCTKQNSRKKDGMAVRECNPTLSFWSCWCLAKLLSHIVLIGLDILL